MTLFDSFILGAIEGITEFLPISSTAHLVLASHALGLGTTSFVKTFEIAIQSGAMCAVILMYWRSFLNKELLVRIIVAFVPTALIGFALYSIIKTFLLESISIIAAALIVGGIILIWFELRERKRMTDGNVIEGTDIRSLSWGRTVAIGVIQAIAVIPGVSRSGATIVGGRLLGLSRMAVVEFSFLLAVPTILSATAYDVYKNYTAFVGSDWTILAVGFITACITACICIRWFLSYIRTHSFVSFGIYRILIALLVVVFLVA